MSLDPADFVSIRLERKSGALVYDPTDADRFFGDHRSAVNGAERELWLTVLYRAYKDAIGETSPTTYSNGRGDSSRGDDQRDALEWFQERGSRIGGYRWIVINWDPPPSALDHIEAQVAAHFALLRSGPIDIASSLNR